MEKAFKIREVKSRIFLFEFKNNYDMCMHFLRYQEFYECPSSKFRGKGFEIFDFMRWYSFKYGKGVFTYPDNWNGFNFPSNIICDLHHKNLITDKNNYDRAMYEAWSECNAKFNFGAGLPINKFYIIGVVKGNGALDHEIAHGLFYLYPSYKKEMTKLVKALNPSIRKKINTSLKKLGYTPKVYVDEAQAYLATGLIDAFGDEDQWVKERNPFRKLFKDFSRSVK